MSIFTYTEDPPFEDPAENKRNFYKLPRRLLLAPYLASNPYFVDFCDAIDTVFDSSVEGKVHALQNIRNPWTTNQTTERAINDARMIDFFEWGGVDHATNVQQVNNLGLQISTAEAVDDLSYRALARFIGSYWFGKGKNTAVDFLNFCLGTNITITPLWTQDYITFAPYPGDAADFIFNPARHPAGDYYPRVGHSVIGGYQTMGYSGGVGTKLQQYFTPVVSPDPIPWYPTTHVRINVPPNSPVAADVIGRLFYEIANYDLVIERLDTTDNLFDIVTNADTQANVMGIAMIPDETVTPPSPFYPIAYHSRVGGSTGGVGALLRQISGVRWDPPEV